ncbi:MAG: hypothetical protein OEY86_14440 [Nitrospira sp.]|nr:hypothetical protein [Nitrospira sp.]
MQTGRPPSPHVHQVSVSDEVLCEGIAGRGMPSSWSKEKDEE